MGNNKTKSSNVLSQSESSNGFLQLQPEVREIVIKNLRFADALCLLMTSKRMLDSPDADEIIWNSISQYESEGTINSFMLNPFWMPRLTKVYDAHNPQKSKKQKSRQKAVSQSSALPVVKTKSPKRKAISQGPVNGAS